ncbi:MAG: hypothetical protein FWF92_02260 [Oscillospiraceae bacterium]|nr:hypothetical protein [Oscillospiraceae bacterium]
MLIDYIYLRSDDNKRVFISNILHDIKYVKNTDISRLYNNFDLSFINDLSGLNYIEFRELCILATYVEQAFYNRGIKPPDWVSDKRLTLEQPYFIGAKTPDLIFHAPQACLNHNVFMLRNNFEVY